MDVLVKPGEIMYVSEINLCDDMKNQIKILLEIVLNGWVKETKYSIIIIFSV